MKLFLVLLSIAMMSHDSLAASIGRLKRDDAAKHKIESYVIKYEDWLERMYQAAKDVIKDMPTTKEYNRYREDWEGYVKMYNEEKHKIDGCLLELNVILYSFYEVYGPYLNLDAPREAKEVKKLFYTHGFQEIENEIKEFMKTFSSAEVMRTAARLSDDEAKKFLGKCENIRSLV